MSPKTKLNKLHVAKAAEAEQRCVLRRRRRAGRAVSGSSSPPPLCVSALVGLNLRNHHEIKLATRRRTVQYVPLCDHVMADCILYCSFGLCRVCGVKLQVLRHANTQLSMMIVLYCFTIKKSSVAEFLKKP